MEGTMKQYAVTRARLAGGSSIPIADHCGLHSRAPCRATGCPVCAMHSQQGHHPPLLIWHRHKSTSPPSRRHTRTASPPHLAQEGVVLEGLRGRRPHIAAAHRHEGRPCHQQAHHAQLHLAQQRLHILHCGCTHGADLGG
jgi:hypothetical protein